MKRVALSIEHAGRSRTNPLYHGRRLLQGVLLAAVLLSGSEIESLAVGFRLPNQDPEAIARGNAFVATADNPSAVYYNPAGITQLEGHNTQAGLYLLDVNVDCTTSAGIDVEDDADLRAVPQLYYTWSPGSRFAVGLGVYVPYGLSLKWPDDTPFRTLAKEGELLYLTINPVVAWQVHPRVAIAAGPTLNVSEAEFKQGVFSATDLFKVKGDGFAAGFNAGVLWKPDERLAFGVQYRFPTTVDYDGEAHYSPVPGSTMSSHDATAEIRFPQYVVGGVSFRPTPNWNFEFNIDWTDWDYVNQVPIRNTPLGDLALAFEWRSSLMYEFGATRQLGKGYFVSCGYFFSENSIPDRVFTPLVPDADLHLSSFGIGHRGTRWSWSFAYHFALGQRTVTGGDPRANGDYDIFNQAWTASVRFTF